jgi:hypothetical protein
MYILDLKTINKVFKFAIVHIRKLLEFPPFDTVGNSNVRLTLEFPIQPNDFVAVHIKTSTCPN